PMLNDSLQVHVTVRPGTFTSLVIVPSDTAVYVGRHFHVQAFLVDARGNRGSATPTFTTSSSAITVTPAGEVASVAIGRGTIAAQAGGRTGTAGVSVP